jgi:hypothetical protein
MLEEVDDFEIKNFVLILNRQFLEAVFISWLIKNIRKPLLV